MRVFVAGDRGMVGSAVCRELESRHPSVEVIVAPKALDLRRSGDVHRFLLRHDCVKAIDAVVLAAARVGGVKVNSERPVDFLLDNLAIQHSVMRAAGTLAVPRLVFLGSMCVYPRGALCPIEESALMSGPLEPSNSAYATAKLAGIELVRAYRRERGLDWVTLMPCNVYGPGDNFDLETSHVVPALLRKAHLAKMSGGPLEVWGSAPGPVREFVYVEDLAEAIVRVALRDRRIPDDIYNVGNTVGTSVIYIEELAALVQDVVGCDGVQWVGGPRGAPLRCLNLHRFSAEFGECRGRDLREGLQLTYDWYRRTANVRGEEA